MPRIPSVADVNPIGASASRLPSVRADAADFGLAIAEGLTSVAMGAAVVGDRLISENRLAEAEEKAKAAKAKADEAQHSAEIRQAAIQMVDTWEYDGSSPQDAATRFSQELVAVEDSRLKNVPPERRAALKASTAQIRHGHGLRVAQRVQNQTVAALARQTGKTLELLQRQAVREPVSAGHFAAEGDALLRAQRDAGALTAEQYTQQSAGFRRNLYAAVVRGQPAVQAMADLEDGVYDAALADPDLKQFLMQETAWRLQSEMAQGAAAAEAQLARVRRGEPMAGHVGAGTRAILAAGEMADTELQAEIAFRVRSDVESLRYAPEAEVAARLAELTSAADAPDAKARQAIQQEVWTQSQAMLRERRVDPAAYVMAQPAVAEAFEATVKDPTLLPDAVAVRLAAQKAMGLTPDERNALSLGERAEVIEGLQRLAPQQRIAAVMHLGRAYGDQVAAVASDLAEAGLSIEMLLAADPSGGAEVLGQLAQASEAKKEAKSTEGDVIQEAAEKLITEGGRAAGSAAGQGEIEREGSSVDGVPPLPQRKPLSISTSSAPKGMENDRQAADDILLRQMQPLRDLDYDAMIDGLDPAEVAAFEAHVGRAARDANASPEVEDLARRFVIRNLRSGMPFPDALEEGLYAADIAPAPPSIPMGEAERERPTPLHIPIPVKHPLVKELMDSWGIISDADVHFTPEYFHSLRWEKRDEQMFLHYFTGDQRTIETAIIQLLGTHMMMLRVLDDCLEGASSRNADWQGVHDQLYARAKPWVDKLEQRAAFRQAEE